MNSSVPPTCRVAGIDYGSVRIGIALSDPGRSIASPLESYVHRNSDLDAERFRRLVEEEKVALFVVGLPVRLDGRESPKSLEARQFGQWLAEVTGVEVVFFDERFTTTQAENLLLEAGMTKKRRKKRVDMLAAQIMLSAYLESQGQSQDSPGPLEDV